MKTVFGILKRDLMALVKNPIALLVVGALMVLPGLYAWYCIIANWDPYANTGRMPIAVVNQDEGASNNLTGDVNVGEQVMGQLEDNDSIDWRFYDDEGEALSATRTGEVYATIVLPSDLSESLVGIFTGGDTPPTVYYYPNEKYNAVATKVTDSAAQTLIRQINQSFSSTVNEKILSSAQAVADDVESRADETNRSAIAEIRAVQADIDKVIVSLDDAAGSIAAWREAAGGASSALAATSEQLPAIASALGQSSNELNALRTATGEFEGKLAGTILSSADTVSRLAGQTSTTLTRATQDLRETQARLEALGAAVEGTGAEASVGLIDLACGLIEGVVEGVGEKVDEVSATAQEVSGSVSSATSRISGEVMPQLNAGTVSLSTSLSKLEGAVDQFRPQVATLLGVLSETDGALQTATGSIADAKTLLSTIGANLKGTVTDIGAIGSALEIRQLSDLLDVDPENVGTFISSPVQMVTEKINPVPNYGTAVAPFYTNLALWIGCFILVSLIKVEVSAEGFEGATSRQRYFGRWLLFVLLALVQSQVICGVDILLGIDCQHPALFMLAGAVCSFTYMNVIFALVKTFRNIGKTLCILLLIMQVPGSSGMYPIQMMPSFFQTIHPLLPFTYGIDAMREALSGMYGLSYLGDVLVLQAVILVALAIGLLLRPFMANVLTMFDDEMNKVGFFASETHAQGEEDQLRNLFRAMTSHGSYSDDFEERAWRFNRTYPKLRRAGVIATFAIPFALLVVLLPFNLTFDVGIDWKLGSLVVMVVVLLVVILALTVLEYTHRMIAEETRLLGLQILGDVHGAGDDLDFLEMAAVMLDGKDGPAEPASPARASAGKSGPAREVFATDMRLGFQSVVGVVVIMLLVVTPAMYAWFNIGGSWDPYGSTGNLKVAVANEDEGYKGDLVPITINIGDTVVSQLRGNTSFDWVFVGKDVAVEGVRSGEYYAAIEIPSDFSRSMMTYLTADSDYPDVVYYTNEKENPIAPIITQKGADAIQENIRVSFTTSVDEIALSVTYDVLGYVTNPRMSDYASTMSRHLDDATRDTRSASREMTSLAGLCRTVAGIVDTTGAAIEGLQAAGASAKGAMADAKTGAADASAAFDGATTVVRDMLDGRSVDVDKIQTVVDVALELLEAGADDVPALIDSAIGQVRASQDEAEDQGTAEYQAVIAQLEQARTHAAGVPGQVAQARADTDALIQGAHDELEEARSYFDDSVAPSIGALRATLGDATSSTSDVVSGLEGALSGIGDSTGGLSKQLGALSNGLTRAAEKLESAATDVDDTKKRVVDALKSGDLKQIEQVILSGDPEALATSLAAPVQLRREAMYPVSNYGSAMAPFYTVLSLWVGALVMISTMRVHVVEERVEELRRRYGKVRPRHEFFGRYGIFGFIGFLQGALVLLGDLMLFHIQCAHPVLFVLFGLFIGQMFCLIVYTITELFGDVGKALCVILLIMQVAASGGTFPVQMLDPLLSALVPYLPFYHAMTLLQECVAGVLWPSAIVSAVALAVMAGAMLVAGLPLRRPFRKLNDFFEEQLERTGYM